MENHTPHNIPSTNRPHHHHHPYNGNGGGREDCWSEGATGTLIDAWGDRYLQLSRGNLRQKDWKEVADAVNSRQDTLNKHRKTDVQCKNRIDTIKKKYKLERSKPGPSKWPFYAHLDELIGANVTPKPPPLPPPVTFTVKKLNPKPIPIPIPMPIPMAIPNANHHNHHNALLYSGGSSSKSRLNSVGSTGSSHGGGDDDEDYDDDEDVGEDNLMRDGRDSSRKKHEKAQVSTEGMELKELAKAIVKFGEIYERIECSKQQQIMELERQRMEFTKDLEFKRMQMFMEAQLDLEKRKRPKYLPSTGAGKKL